MPELLHRGVWQRSVLQRSQCPPQACELKHFDPQHGHWQEPQIRFRGKIWSSSAFWVHLLLFSCIFLILRSTTRQIWTFSIECEVLLLPRSATVLTDMKRLQLLLFFKINALGFMSQSPMQMNKTSHVQTGVCNCAVKRFLLCYRCFAKLLS